MIKQSPKPKPYQTALAKKINGKFENMGLPSQDSINKSVYMQCGTK
tara:strand:+ start:852 stop:989 length:138 start_codon:yes stop_codon:yes gene_type:complete